MATSTAESLDSIINQITTSNSPAALNHTLRNALPKESRDIILASALSNNQDPLAILDMRENTVGVLYILAARLNTPNTPPPPWQLVQQFCQTYIPEQARLAPDRVTALAKGIAAHAADMDNPRAAIQPLSDLLRRYPPDASYLTTIHPILALACTSTHNYTALLPVLSTPITNIDLAIAPDLSYNDNLIYHYLGGIALAALKRWGPAEEFFEICVSSPGVVPAALQLEALKKLKLVQLIATGKTAPLPKYTHALLPRLLKNTPYNAFINAYPHDVDALTDILQREAQLFAAEKNTGLLQQALARAPRWTLKKLTATYVTVSLADIARAVRIESEDDVRALILSMIESNDISAQLSSTGTVTFSDPPPSFTPAQVDAVLADVQTQAAALEALEREVGRSKEFLGKAVKNRDDSWVPQTDEEVFSLNAAGIWAEDAGFP
ncbi:putative cop9 signalosome complex subunit 3 [Lyophyllum shimeji]|uniref:COP9 signalosome complex subunit 3 n=1 Tax=Lyophyllum shimeji TaxID=47721 RepID=A0A9P3PT78_LYOSH|nr:putative cop9 signalosome complex subunit 3 [Lyophyllum shimeji]